MSAASGLRNAGSDAAAPAESSCPVSRGAAARVLRAWNIADLRRLAKRRLPRAIFDFFDGAAEDETTLADNRAAFERVRLAPKTLAGVARIDTSAAILGARSKLPIAVGPTGGIGFGWPFADVGVARAAAQAGIPYTLSTMATASIERIAREAGGRLWVPAYIFGERGRTAALVEGPRQFGYEGVKGILRADEAERLAAMGVDAVVVSNHGGRQLDGAVAGLDALPPIARAVKGRMSVLVDGGVRRGVDAIKAVALGAEGVMLGRATLYGACAAGEAGAARALQILRDELVRSMQLSGVRSIAEIGPDLLAPPN